MKKKLFGIAIVAIVAAGAAWNVNENKNEVSLSDLALENVEALAGGEQGGGGIQYYEHHCGSRVGTQCITSVTGPLCGGPRSCP